MFKTIRNAWKLPELRRKLLFVIFALLIFRVGAAIPVPYINTEYLQDYIAANSGTIFGLLNTLSGSALSQATLFALSIQPYINASIIIQLLTIAIPALERLAKDGGEEGKKKIQSITRYTTLAIGLLQGFGYYTLIRSYGLLTNEGIWLPSWSSSPSPPVRSSSCGWENRSPSSAWATVSRSSCLPVSSPACPA